MEQLTYEILCESCHRKDEAWDVFQEKTKLEQHLEIDEFIGCV